MLRSRHLARQRGAVAIVVALSMAVLIGFVGLALDTGKLYVAKTELQNSADACALAAAQELTTATPLAVSEAAGITTGRMHNVLFQQYQIELASDAAVTFSSALNGPYVTKDSISPLAATFVRCDVTREQIPTWLMHVLNMIPGVEITPTTVSARAVASRVPAQTNCALPVALCSTAVNPLSPPAAGTWIQGAIGPSGGQNAGSGGLTGNFKWVDFTPPAGGASELGQMLTSPGTCNLPSTGAEVGQPGNVSSAANDWNSRFGIYQGNVQPEAAIPDFTGYAYTELTWPAQFNAFDDFRARRAANAPYQTNAVTGLNARGNISGADFLSQNGADRRLAVAPIVDCAGFASGSTAPVVNWACVLMLHPINNSAGGSGTGADRMWLEYRGLSSELGSPCASLGVPGGANSQGPMVPTLVQ
ncbi:pilus assembly protein TadG-related protein [Oxalobacteraceae bacterium R-40]|uniref:Pilus assembly protein TadG-related protein n=1 Tax=Keguizhuia sedimenti TaxID=3064264 RepID=A0ABU1BJ88_9BURK|nr:pilus assembly protein TadG-related protein [Oxalobacteraceae bacterium R-40]